MFSGLLVLTLANGRNVGYTNKKTGDKAIYKARFSKPFNPWVEGSSPSALTWEIELESPPFPREGGAFFISARPFGCRLNVNGLLLIFV
jgi:hypothetical protein